MIVKKTPFTGVVLSTFYAVVGTLGVQYPNYGGVYLGKFSNLVRTCISAIKSKIVEYEFVGAVR